MNPDADTIVKWGGNLADLTTRGEGWRLISSLFIHIGILHLVFNMYGLYFIGQLLEPMLGKPIFIAADLFSGVIASLISLWWHQDQVMVSAGASGAIFGLFGLFLFLLITDLIPRAIRDSLLKSVGIFVGYNLIMGMRGGVDNAAHMGGLAGGFVAGVIGYYFVLKIQTVNHGRKWIVAASLLIAAGLIAMVSMKGISGTGSYMSKTAEEKFNEVVAEFTNLEKEALEVYERSNTLTKEEYIQQLRTITLENWKKGESLFRELGAVQLNERLAAIQAEMVNYCRLNQEKTSLTIRIFSELSQEYNDALNKKEEEIERSVLRVQHLSGVDTTQ
jgi:rhomboid protease GluP